MDNPLESSRVSRRAFLAGTAATIGGMVLASCGGTASTPSGSGGPVTLRWSMWSATPAERAIWEELAADVTRVHPTITVKLETIAFNDYWGKLQTQIASSTQADIVSMQSLRMPAFAARRALQPLQPFIAKDANAKPEDFFSSIRDGLSFKNQIYAFGYDVGPIHLYYNKDMFAAAGVEVPSATTPMTWEELREKAGKLTNASKQEYGYVMQPGFGQLVPYIWSGGGDYMDADEKTCTLDSPDAKAAIQFIVDLINKDKYAAPVTDLANPLFQSERFYSGKVAMMANGPWEIVNARKNAQFDWDIAPLPAGKAGSITWVAGSGFGISAATKFPEETWKALSVITSTDSLNKVAKSGRGYPARQSSVPAFIVPGEKPTSVDVVEKVLSQTIAKTRFYRTTTTWQEIEVMLTQEFNPIFLGQRSVDQMLAAVKPKFDTLLQKHQELLNS